MTPAELAFDIINRATVQACKYAPRGDAANAVYSFLGRHAGYETFITQNQYNLMRRLLGGDNTVITHGVGDSRFGGFVRPIFSEKKNKEYYLLVFGGYVPEASPAPEATPSAPAATPANTDRANEFAALLIKGATEKGRVSKDSLATAGQDDYLVTWLSKAQADALVAQLPQDNIKPDGSFLTVAAGSFAYWGKKRTASGALLLCWMGDVGEVKPEPKPEPVEVIPPGCRIPLDMDIPF